MNKFRIKGVGLDTTMLDFSPDINLNNFEYLHTSLRANNDYLLRDYVLKLTYDNQDKIIPLMITVDFLDGVETSLMGHLAELIREEADLVLLNPKCDFENNQEVLVNLLDSKIVKNFGISKPKNLDELKKTKEFLECLGIECNYVSLNISPFEFNYDIIKYCKEKSIYIVGFNSFGGHLTAPSLIDSFTVPYLLEFASYHSDIVLLSGRDLYNSISNKKYLESLINRETENDYDLNKSINKVIQPLKKTVYTGFKFEDGSLLPYDNPSLTYDPEALKINFGKSFLPEIKEATPEPGSLEEEIYTLYKTFHKPIDGNDDDFFSIIRYQLKRLFIVKFDRKQNWKLMFANIGRRILVFNAVRRTVISGGWFRKDKEELETRSFLMYYLNGTFLFKEVKMEEKKPEDLTNESE